MTREELAFKYLDKLYRRMKVAIRQNDVQTVREMMNRIERQVILIQAEGLTKKSKKGRKKYNGYG